MKVASSIFLLGSWACVFAAPTTKSVNLLMPEVSPQKADTYLCTSIDADDAGPYITEFLPHAKMEIAHHILLYGCTEPGSTEKVWNCGEMSVAGENHFPVCASGSKILYAWAMDAPSLKLPKDVAFQVGGNTGIKKLTMQVHYKNVSTFLPPLSKKDSSGLTLVTTDEPKGRSAGVYLMVTGGVIPKKSREYMEAACPFPGGVGEIHPFAFRTHAHSLGRVISGYRVRDGEWTEIGRMDPRKPQMFYNVTQPMTVKGGDILAARCTMENELDHDVAIGATQNDEMCNFYIMYYVDGEKTLSEQTSSCFTYGPPYWYLKDYADQDSLNLPDMPDTASLVPGTTKPLLPTTAGAKMELPTPEDDASNSETEEEEMLDDFLSRVDPRDQYEVLAEMMSGGRYQQPLSYYYPDDPQ